MDLRFDDDFYACEHALAFLDCDAHGNEGDCGDDGGISCGRDVLCYLCPYSRAKLASSCLGMLGARAEFFQ